MTTNHPHWPYQIEGPTATVEKLGNENAGAIFSKCMSYRYALWRKLPSGEGDAVFIGLNPSVADHEQLDPTCKRCQSFAMAWGCSRYVMLNAFSYRATDPKKMLDHHEPIGELNDEYLRKFTKDARIIVAAWGTHCDDLRAKAVCQVIARPLECLGKNHHGSPKHPLYLPATAKRVPFWGC